jgi:outer membrane lipoprotein-sorting protein
MRILLLLAGAAILSGRVLAAETAEMSASDVINKSEAAYAAVKTYVGTTTVRTKADVGAIQLDQISTAKINFMRPGKVRIEGRTASRDVSGKDGHPFAIVSDGKTTWKSWAIQNNGAFQEVQNVSMAGMAGVAQGAAEGIPAALMKSEGAWTGGHDPFRVPRLSAAQLAGHEPIDGVDCYKLVARDSQLGDVTLWIDSQSFFLRQMKWELSEAQLALGAQKAEEYLKKIGKGRPVNVPAVKSQIEVFSFTIDQVDGPVDAKLFTDPTDD